MKIPHFAGRKVPTFEVYKACLASIGHEKL
jgi:hypothetical protein